MDNRLQLPRVGSHSSVLGERRLLRDQSQLDRAIEGREFRRSTRLRRRLSVTISSLSSFISPRADKVFFMQNRLMLGVHRRNFGNECKSNGNKHRACSPSSRFFGLNDTGVCRCVFEDGNVNETSDNFNLVVNADVVRFYFNNSRRPVYGVAPYI